MNALTNDISLKVLTTIVLVICSVGTYHVLQDTQKPMYDSVMQSMCAVSYDIQRAIATGDQPR